MKGQALQVRVVGGMQQDIPQDPVSASLIENWTVDRTSTGLSSRVGYEKYRPNPAAQWAPFSALPRIDSLFVAQQLPGGARQSILFESNGSLFLFYEVGQAATLVNLLSRTVPTSTEAGAYYCQVGDRIVVTNGQDAPLVINPWPLPRASDITATVSAQIVRPLGFAGPPPQPNAIDVATVGAGATVGSAASFTGNATSNWYPTNGAAISFPGLFGHGYSDGVDAEVTNNYRYKVTFISDTGSESPLSQSAAFRWTIEKGNQGFQYAPSLRLPLGPKGTKARRVYRTLEGGSTYYFVADVRNNVEELFHGFRATNALGFEAPSETDSITFPAPRARVCASFKDSLFLDGGANESDTLFFSKPGFIDQYGSLDYIRLPSDGGSVSGLYSYYNNLIVFRENGVDVVTGTYPNFTAQTVTRQVSCRSPHSVDAVPGLGVFFLAQDGVYALQGGLDGGAVFQVVEIGQAIGRELNRITEACTPRAVGKYCPLDRTYHLYIPVDGDDRPSLGVLYHVEKQGWSIRTGFPVGCLGRLHGGELIFGHNEGAAAGQNAEAGLFVLSSIRSMGGNIQDDTYVTNPPPTSVYQSAWHDFGDAQAKKQVQYVTLWITTTGSVLLKLKHYKDFDHEAAGQDEQYIAQPPDAANQPVYDAAVADVDKWQESRLVPIRIPIAQQSCSWFKFSLETTDDILFIGYEVEYVVRGTQVIAGKKA